MRSRLGLLCVFALLSCGGDDAETAQERLQGDWFYEDDEYECVHVINVKDDFMEVKEVCQLEEGGVAVVLHNGFFTATADRITFDLVASSCEEPDVFESARYSFQGDTLRLVFPDGVQAYERIEPVSGAGGGSATFGCFDDDGEFIDRKVEKL